MSYLLTHLMTIQLLYSWGWLLHLGYKNPHGSKESPQTLIRSHLYYLHLKFGNPKVHTTKDFRIEIEKLDCFLWTFFGKIAGNLLLISSVWQWISPMWFWGLLEAAEKLDRPINHELFLCFTYPIKQKLRSQPYIHPHSFFIPGIWKLSEAVKLRIFKHITS